MQWMLRPGLLIALLALPSAWAKEPFVPAPVNEGDFKDLLANSPFTRPLNLSDSLVLTGVADLGGEPIATIVDSTRKESFVVSADANALGWRMLQIDGNRSDLESITARISVPGGEIISVRFSEQQVKPGAAKPPEPGNGEGGRTGKGKGDRREKGGGERRGKGMMGKGDGAGRPAGDRGSKGKGGGGPKGESRGTPGGKSRTS